ncbi:MAG: hypothetical protein PUB43_07560 [Oscillospiraceae bacterium]|nr:hypothetical protein [Oscillospiraceae bacterium]
MKNSKWKIILCVVIIIQLMIPGVMLVHNYRIYSDCETSGLEVKLRVSSVYFFEDWIDISTQYNYAFSRGDKIGMTRDSEGFALMENLENQKIHTIYYCKGSFLQTVGQVQKEDILYAGNMTEEQARKLLSKSINWSGSLLDNSFDIGFDNPDAYLLCKVYRGVLMPIALYAEDQLVFTFK